MEPQKRHVAVEVSGCLTTCAHCWAAGGDYGAMPVGEAVLVLEQLGGYFAEQGVSLGAFPMHEVLAHPRAAELIRLFAPYLDKGRYDPILTPGAPLASRPDWGELIAVAKECGAVHLHVHFHGYGGEHDRQLMRPGAFAETCLAVRRAQEAGLSTGANVFLTKPGLVEIDRFLETLRELGLDGPKAHVGVAGYFPHARGRRYEELRPELADLLPVVDRIDELKDAEWWSDLAGCTEAAWVGRALEGDWPEDDWGRTADHPLVVRPNLDLHTGTTGVYRARHGNLRREDPREVIARAFHAEPVSQEQLYFPGVEAPEIAELAARYGDPDGTKVYADHTSVRWRWLDRARV
jgi:MoaA/NifB/PqqE/SkfB family radical SAM enzyme